MQEPDPGAPAGDDYGAHPLVSRRYVECGEVVLLDRLRPCVVAIRAVE